MIDIASYTLEDLLLTAIKSEVESNNLYTHLAKNIQNGLLQDKLAFLAAEEEKHKLYIEDVYKAHFPDQKITLPDKTPVPLPEVQIPDEEVPLSKILGMAMEAEKAANEFYISLSERFEQDSKIHNMLVYFSDMELGHYKLLEVEKESMQRFEQADVYWEIVHVGP